MALAGSSNNSCKIEFAAAVPYPDAQLALPASEMAAARSASEYSSRSRVACAGDFLAGTAALAFVPLAAGVAGAAIPGLELVRRYFLDLVGDLLVVGDACFREEEDRRAGGEVDRVHDRDRPLERLVVTGALGTTVIDRSSVSL